MEDGKRVVKPFGRRFNVWMVPRSKNETRHPAVFPLKLAADHIKSWSNVGDLVCDPMSGSGKAAIAAMNEGRRFVVNDISLEYCEIMVERIKRHIECKGAS